MEYRKLPHGEEKISLLGMGSSYIGAAPEKEICETVAMAVENGVNYFDMASADAAPFPAYGKALAGMRDKVYFQIHFGANYENNGKYGRNNDLETVKRSIDWQLKSLQTDYIDFGFIHCLDKPEEWEQYVSSGILQYLLDMKAQGVVRHLGGSTHTPAMANKILDQGADMLMFSINAAYDYKQGSYGIGEVDERMNLYRRCEKEGVGISVMKPFGGGQLLDANASPFKKALTHYQCIQYALDKPGVLTVLPGIRNREDLKHLLGFFNAKAEERDYSVIGSFTPQDAEGVCVYCNHCQPCPVGLDVGLINKYYDLALAGDEMAKDHYRKLPLKAGACVGCGHCESHCPFRVKQIQRMAEIKEYFGE